MLLLGSPSIPFLITFLLALVVAVTFHEFAHNYIAHLMGDPTPANNGKLTLNPMAHVFWQGWIMFILIGFAPLGFAQINPRLMNNPRWGYFAAVSAGPLSNLLLAIVFAIPAQLLFTPFELDAARVGATTDPIAMFFALSIFYNLILFMFNLLPMFPIDGWKMVWAVLPPDLAYTWESWQQYSQYALFGLIFISFAAPQLNLLGMLIFQPAFVIYRVLIGA